MTVTALVGSARKHGITAQATRQLLERLESFGDVRTELVFLDECDVRVCRGCKTCFALGEERCPLRDDRDLLVGKMMASDGVVIASPVYSFQVSGLTKVFLDRLGFVFHRPRFFGKTFTCIVVEAFYGGRDAQRYLEFVGGGLGFNVVRGSRMPGVEPLLDRDLRRMDEALEDHARRFHRRLLRPAHPVPSTFQLMVFRNARQTVHLTLGEGDRDYRHYRDQGWFESDYWYPTHLGPVKKVLGAAFDRMGARGARQRAEETRP